MWILRFSFVALVTLLSGAAAQPAFGDSENLPQLSSKPVKISLFKNGLGYVERAGQLPKGVDEAELSEMPLPVHGTFWVGTTTEGVELRSLVASEKQPETPAQNVANMSELLEANEGRELELVVVGPDGKVETLKAKVRLLQGVQPDPKSDNREISGFRPLATYPITSRQHTRYSQPSIMPAAVSSALIVLETYGAQLVIDRSAVRQVRGENLNLTIPGKAPPARSASVKIAVDGNRAGADLRVSYLAKGITWAPSYRLDLLDDKTVRLVAKAEVMNDLEDLDGAQCSAIAGFPNLQFANIEAPLAYQGGMADWLKSLSAPPPTTSTRREAVLSQQIMFNAAYDATSETRVDFDPGAFGGRGDADLFFYDLGEVTLKRGERGYFPLFAADVPYESVYDCRIERVSPKPGERGEMALPDVWHALRLSNNTKQPWTTAPATVIREGLLIGQDTLYFTSLGSTSLLRFTKALDVRVSSDEKETARQRNVSHRGYNSWDLVTAEGEINVTNLKPVEVAVIVQTAVEGEIMENPQEAKLNLTESGVTGVNPKSNLTWEVKVKPRETVRLAYTYKKYVR